MLTASTEMVNHIFLTFSCHCFDVNLILKQFEESAVNRIPFKPDNCSLCSMHGHYSNRSLSPVRLSS